MHPKFTKKQKIILGLLVVGVGALVGTSRFIVDRKNRAVSIVAITANTVTQQTNTAIAEVKGTSTTTPNKITVASAGNIAVGDSGVLTVPITVTNNTAATVEFSPGLQFTLKANQNLYKVILPQNAELLGGGPLAAGQSRTGNLYFDATAPSSLELLFTPDVTKPDLQESVVTYE